MHAPRSAPQPPPVLKRVALGLHVLLVAAVLVVLASLAVPYLRAAAEPEPPRTPTSMEEVDWSSPDSSRYCLACHREVGVAMAGLDVKQGHPQNVKLNDVQLAAVAELGTVPGPGGTLICMSCHRFGATGPHMLADTLVDGRLCEHCHPGHYARHTPHDLRESAPLEQNRAGQTVLDGGPCSACHLSHRYARDFEPTLLDPDGRCVTCHAEHRVAAQHARQAMDHPDSRCLECHDPHDMTHGEFLKQPMPDLCVTCHVGYADGSARGMHPLAPVAGEWPAALVAAGAPQPADYTLDCATCHAAHAGRFPDLLRFAPDTNELCLACHAERLTADNHGRLPGHGQSPTLDEAQRAAVESWGGRVGKSGELLCVSCHRVHGGNSAARLLAFEQRPADTCIACHSDYTAVAGTTHDLRISRPQHVNVLGQAALAAGECGACHLAHRPAQTPAPSAGDARGQCLACHQAEGCAADRLAGTPDHPGTTCRDCHDPHRSGAGAFLVRPERELCSGCHAEQARLADGPHDVANARERWPAAAAEVGELCLTCHVAHGGADADLLRLRERSAPNEHDGACLACHASAAWHAASDIASLHPRQVSPDHAKVNVALIPADQAGNRLVGCQTCHNPHGPALPGYLARVAPGESTASLCLHCHVEKEYIRYTGHSTDNLRRFGFDADSCRPCHAMHANPEATWGQMLSPRFLMEVCDVEGNENTGCVPCLACHHVGGPAPIREVASHPEMIMLNVTPTDAPGYLPLFNIEGHIDPQGHVVCRTCHLSHGRLDLVKRLAANLALTPEEQRALNVQVRSFLPPNVCTDCHGPDARNKFLYFHDAARRAAENRPSVPGGR